MEVDREKTEIPKKTIYRLSLYQRCLSKLMENGHITVSSSTLAKAVGVKPAQLRRDISHVGQFGTRGLGYPVEELRQEIRDALGREHLQPVVLIGAGNLGSALLRYGGFQKEGFEVIAAFDAVPEAVMKREISVPVYGIEEVEHYIRKDKVKLAILCVPAENAQEAANNLVMAGVQGILNFSPSVLQVPENITVNNVDLALELENVSFFIDRGSEPDLDPEDE